MVINERGPQQPHADFDILAAAAPLPAPVRDAAVQRVQRQSLQERDGPLRGLRGLSFGAGRSAVLGHRLGPVHPAIFRSLRAGRSARRHARQGEDHPHRQGGRNRHHDDRRQRSAARLVGSSDHCTGHSADADGAVRDGHPLDLLRADQIRDPAAASRKEGGPGRDRTRRGRHLHRDPRRHDPRRLDPGRMGRGSGLSRRRCSVI